MNDSRLAMAARIILRALDKATAELSPDEEALVMELQARGINTDSLGEALSEFVADPPPRLMFFYGIFKDERRAMSYDGEPWKKIGERRVEGYTLYARTDYGSIGYARPKEGAHVEGVLYEVPDRTVLGMIDSTEQHPKWYRRTEVVTSEGEKCEMYVLVQEAAEEKPDTYVEIGPNWSYEVVRSAQEKVHANAGAEA